MDPSVSENTVNDFSQFNLIEPLRAAIKDLGFSTPTPIQIQSIPKLMAGADLIGCAQTGSGKTAAFALPMFEKLQKEDGKSALILAPTRELAEQIHRVCQDIGRYLPMFRTALLIGGTSMFPQKRTLSRDPCVIVATPGRLLDHLQQRTARLDNLCYLVLDEADRMLDMGFAPQLRAILRYVPRERQSLLFSATFPSDIASLSREYLKDPVRVEIERAKELEPKIKETNHEIDAAAKKDALIDAINSRTGSILVFARTQQRTERVTDFLEKYGMDVGQLHGGRTHGQRQAAIRGFREGEFRILVATDIAARGLDIEHVETVINFDLPRCPEDYTHRIGRTGRAGREGEAVSLIEPTERGLWKQIQRLRSGHNAPSNFQERGGRPSGRFSNQRSFGNSSPRFEKRPRPDSNRGPRAPRPEGARREFSRDSRPFGNSRPFPERRGGRVFDDSQKSSSGPISTDGPSTSNRPYGRSERVESLNVRPVRPDERPARSFNRPAGDRPFNRDRAPSRPFNRDRAPGGFAPRFGRSNGSDRAPMAHADRPSSPDRAPSGDRAPRSDRPRAPNRDARPMNNFGRARKFPS